MKQVTILNVDDHSLNRYIRTQVLEQAGYRVVEAGNGAEALSRFAEEHPQLVLLDMNLPDIDGPEVSRLIKAGPLASSVIVLHISATSITTRDQVLALEGGADGYLVEPVEPELLLATVRSLLRLWTAEAKLGESLRQTRELAARYQSLTEAIPDLVYTATAEGVCDYVNPHFAAYKSPEEAFGDGWTSVLHEDDRERTVQLWNRSVATGEPFEIEFRMRRADGVYRWHLSRARPVRGDGGTIVQWVGTTTDIHERKILNEELRRRHQEFASLAEHSPDIIARIGCDLRYLYINSAISRYSRYKPEDYQGRSHRDVGWNEELCAVWDEALLTALNTCQEARGNFSYDFEGQRRYFAYRVVPEFGSGGEVESLLSIAEDCTDRTNAEMTLRENERKLRRLVESNIIGVVFTDNDQIVYANDIFLEMVGYTREDLNAGALNWRKMTPLEHANLDERALNELREHGTCGTFEKEFFRKDGTRVPVLLGAAVLEVASRAVCFALDLTELKASERAQARANRVLVQSNEDLKHFAYAASHDLQEPLRTISSYSELLERRYSHVLDQEGCTLLSFVQSSAQGMHGLLQDLLAFSQVQELDLSSISPVNAEGLVKMAIANLQSGVEESGATVSWDCLPALTVDAARFLQVFQNLIGNAIKYRNPAAPPVIHISAVEDGDSTVLCVRDNGMGFEQHFAEQIFGLFKRLHGREIPGTGMGLAIVKKIVERHEGRIWAESAPGKGSVFFIRLPNRSGAISAV